jgi:ribosome-associated protein
MTPAAASATLGLVAAKRPKPAASSSEALATRIAALCVEKRAEDPVVLDVRGLVDYMDFLVIVTGRSERQNRAIADHVKRTLKRDERLLALSAAGGEAGSWICLDFVDVVLHVFDGPTRSYYDLELLWADAPRREVPIASAHE